MCSFKLLNLYLLFYVQELIETLVAWSLSTMIFY
jgi:hypothetical protein